MRISNKGRYGIQAVFDLAYHGGGEAAQIKDICERQGIPVRFLEQVFQDLRRAGIVRSKRGPRGGYQLARPAAEVLVGDVVRATEGPIQLGPAAPRGRTQQEASGLTVTRHLLDEVSTRLEEALDGVSLADLCERADRLGVSRRAPARYVYAI